MIDKKILVIEDDLSLAGALIAKLDLEGFVTMNAKNGEEGLELAFSNHPDLILLDIIMPKMDGITMLKKLRVDSWGKDVPVVILSNLSDADKNIDVVDSSAQAYLIKSDWTLQDVVSKVKEILKIA
jgi:DNA-binding response OmpR family regulator